MTAVRATLASRTNRMPRFQTARRPIRRCQRRAHRTIRMSLRRQPDLTESPRRDKPSQRRRLPRARPVMALRLRGWAGHRRPPQRVEPPRRAAPLVQAAQVMALEVVALAAEREEGSASLPPTAIGTAGTASRRATVPMVTNVTRSSITVCPSTTARLAAGLQVLPATRSRFGCACQPRARCVRRARKRSAFVGNSAWAATISRPSRLNGRLHPSATGREECAFHWEGSVAPRGSPMPHRAATGLPATKVLLGSLKANAGWRREPHRGNGRLAQHRRPDVAGELKQGSRATNVSVVFRARGRPLSFSFLQP